jgi:hypothetical protein
MRPLQPRPVRGCGLELGSRVILVHLLRRVSRRPLRTTSASYASSSSSDCPNFQAGPSALRVGPLSGCNECRTVHRLVVDRSKGCGQSCFCFPPSHQYPSRHVNPVMGNDNNFEKLVEQTQRLTLVPRLCQVRIVFVGSALKSGSATTDRKKMKYVLIAYFFSLAGFLIGWSLRSSWHVNKSEDGADSNVDQLAARTIHWTHTIRH